MDQTIESNGIQYFDEDYFDFVLNYHGIIGSTYSYKGFQDLKHLYKLNKMFVIGHGAILLIDLTVQSIHLNFI